ncbi:MAG: hypothetical protein IJD39_09815 [Clostridia bacterium]|nr:hypothetical protein [Clostridia bacterium]
MKEQNFSRLLHEDAMHTPLPPALRAKALDAVRRKENTTVKKKWTVSLAFAIALILICSVALAVANQAGILDFTGRTFGSYVPQNAGDYVQKGNATVENDVFSASIREQYYDGRTTRIVMDFTPKEENVLFIGADFWADLPWQELIHLDYANHDLQDRRTLKDMLSEYDAAYLCGFTLMLPENGEFAGGSGDCVLNPETGVLTCYDESEFALDLEQRDVIIRVSAFPVLSVEEDDFILDFDHAIRADITLSLISTFETQSYENAEPMVFPSVGVQVDRLLIDVKPQEIYATIECTIVDEAAYQKVGDALWFEFIDPNSTETAFVNQRLSTGPSGSGTVSHPEDLHFQQHETLGLKELYDTYTLRAFDAWNKERYETCTFIMKPVK